MKTVLRYYLINLVSLYSTTQIIAGLTYSGGLVALLTGGAVFTIINLLLVPLIKILLLPINLLTLGFFSWTSNVLALYALTSFLPQFKLAPYQFPGFEYGGFSLPALDLTTLWVAIAASFLIGLFTHLLQWLVH